MIRLATRLPAPARGPLVRAATRGRPFRIAGGAGVGLLLRAAAQAEIGSAARGTLETSVQEALRRSLGPGGVLYDVGANLGFFSVIGARLVGSEGEVHAFEPVAESAALVRLAALDNGFGWVHVHETAVGEGSGVATLLVVGDASWSKLTTRGTHAQAREARQVPVVSLDEVVADGARPPTVVKLDAEGAELDVVRGMRDTLASHRPVVIAELHETNAEFVALMDEAGYAVSNLDGTEDVATAGHVHALASHGEGRPGR